MSARVVIPLGLLAAAGFLSSAGARVIDPLLHVIATDFGVTVPAVSVVLSAFTLPYGLNQLVLGPVGDRYGKLRVMLGALLGYAAATAGCAMAADLPMLTLLRVMAGASSAGLIPVCMAYIGDAVPYAERQETLGRFLNGVVLAQALAGPLGGVFGQYVGWRGVFVLLSGSALAVAGTLALRLGDLPDRRREGATFDRANYAQLARARPARLLLVGTFLDGMLLVGCFPFFAPYLHEHFGLAYAQVGLLLAWFAAGAFAYTRRAGWLLRHLGGEPGLVLLGGALVALAMGLAALTPAWWPFVPIEVMLGFGFFALHGVVQARATELLPAARSTAVSSFAFMLFLGQSVGALLMGRMLDALGYRDALLLDAACAVLLTLWLRGLVRSRAA